MHDVLQLDINGTPQAWLSVQEAALHYATDAVAWYDGDGPLTVLRGGWNVRQGRQSLIEVHPIIALRGASRINLFEVEPAFSRGKLFRRDRFTCAYCGEGFGERELTVDHIFPQARGGRDSWMNCVASCAGCNMVKRDRTPEEAGMPLVFLPYRPSRFEDFLLEGRRIRADVHQWLASRLPKGSRLC
jgi:5-methylcytosine-specific restriction endonuclease McrA